MLRKLVISTILLVSANSAVAGPDFFGFSSNFTNEHVDDLNIRRYNSHVNKYETYMGLESHGVSLNITAWSSSLHGNVSSCFDHQGYDQCITRAELTEYGNSGLGAINTDEHDDNPNHSVDNNTQDYDMLLLSFSEAVNISSVYTGWNYKLVNEAGSLVYKEGKAEASLMALSNTRTLDTSSPFSRTDTWEDTLSDGWQIIDENFGVDNNGKQYFGGGSYYQMPVISTGIFSKHWLVGAANNVSRNLSTYNGHPSTDYIKIAGVDFMKLGNSTDSGTISAPASIGIFALGFAAVMLRRKVK